MSHGVVNVNSAMNPEKTPINTHDPGFDAVVSFDGQRARLLGPTGSGKTLALLNRALRLAHRGEATLFVVAPPAAQPLRSLVVRGRRLGDGEISVHTWASLAAMIYVSSGGKRRILDRVTEEALLCDMVAVAADPSLAKRITAARRAYVESWLGFEELATHADAAEVADRWAFLNSVTEQFAGLCRARELIDQSTLMIEATHALRADAKGWQTRFPHVVLDDFESTTFAQYRLAVTFVGLPDPDLIEDDQSPETSRRSVVVAGDLGGPVWDGPAGAPWLAAADRHFCVDADLVLSGSSTHRRIEKPVEAVHVRHRALRGSAIVSELTRLFDAGFVSDEIAIIVAPGEAGRDLARSIQQSAARRQIRVNQAETVADDSVAAAVADAAHAIVNGLPLPDSIRTLGISESTSSLRPGDNAATLVFRLWQQVAPRLLRFDTADLPATEVRHPPHRTEALRALHLETSRALDQGMSDTEAIAQARQRSFRARGGVEIVSDFDARGRRWPVVIVAGFEEGVRPPHPRPIDYFDLEILNKPDLADQSARHQQALVEARRRAENLLARGERLSIAITAPEPGVLASRFIEGIPLRLASLSTTELRPVEVLDVSNNNRGFWEDRQIRGSASSLETFRNCPLEYTYKYVLNIATESGPQALVGTITHDVLEAFYHPAHADDRSPERLRQVFEARWSDDEFDYLAQASEYRATILTMLENVAQRHADEQPEVFDVERSFSIPLRGYTLSGKIDRIDIVGGDAEQGLSIIDYKTGKWQKGAGEESLQLGVYYLAARHDPELAAIGAPQSLALYFLKDDRYETQLVHPELEQDWTEIIVSTLAQIAQGEHRPSAEASCEYCSFGRVCPTQPEGRFVHISPSPLSSSPTHPRK